MNCVYVYERTPSENYIPPSRLTIRKNVTYEDDLAQRWWALPPASLLPATDGNTYHLLFVGRPGGPAGPDVRDAVLQPAPVGATFMAPFFSTDSLAPCDSAGKTGGMGVINVAPTGRLIGDIEFHTRASDWVTHQHHNDPRYNQVILHVVLYCDTTQPTRRQDGCIVPVCSLNDLPPTLLLPARQQTTWPCQQIMAAMSEEECSQCLRRAGLLRFEAKTSAFVEDIRTSITSAPGEAALQHYDPCLLAALAEALGYGRDRDLFRAIGLYLLGRTTELPEPLGRSPVPSPLDSKRLAFLRHLMQTWQQASSSHWQQVRERILHKELAELRSLFWEQGLSLARTDILICNVALPFAAAIALLEQDTRLLECATNLYLAHPGLPSNHITRMMCQQMGLIQEPRGACQQQGLHHIYQETCKAKRCSMCIAGRERL